MILGIGHAIAGIVITKVSEKVIDRGIEKIRSSDSLVGRLLKKILGEKDIGKYKANEFKKFLLNCYKNEEIKVKINEKEYKMIINESFDETLDLILLFEQNKDFNGIYDFFNKKLDLLKDFISIETTVQLQSFKE